MDPAGSNLSRSQIIALAKTKITLLGMEISKITDTSEHQDIQHLYDEAVKVNEQVTDLRVSGETLVQRIGNVSLQKKARKSLEKVEKLAIKHRIVLDRGESTRALTPLQEKLFREVSPLVRVSGKARGLKFAHVNNTLEKLLKESIAAKDFRGLFQYLDEMITKTKPGTKGHSKLLILQASLMDSLEVNDICEQSLSFEKLKPHEENILHSRNINPLLLTQYEQRGKNGLSAIKAKKLRILEAHGKKVLPKLETPFVTTKEFEGKMYTLRFRVTSKGQMKVKVRDNSGRELLSTFIPEALRNPVSTDSQEANLAREVFFSFLLEKPTDDLYVQIYENPDLQIEYPTAQVLPLSVVEKIEHKIQEARKSKISIRKMLTHVRDLKGGKYDNTCQLTAQGTSVPEYELRLQDGRVRFTFKSYSDGSRRRSYIVEETDSGKLQFTRVRTNGREKQVTAPKKRAMIESNLAACVPKLYGNVGNADLADGIVVNQLDLLLQDDPLGMLSTYADVTREFTPHYNEVLPRLSNMQDPSQDAGGPTQDLLTKAMPVWMDAARAAPPSEKRKAFEDIGNILAKSHGTFPVPRDFAIAQIRMLSMVSRNFSASATEVDRGLLIHAQKLPGNERGTVSYNRLQRAFLYNDMIEDIEGVFLKPQESRMESKQAQPSDMATTFEAFFGNQDVADAEAEAISENLSDTLMRPPKWEESYDDIEFTTVSGLMDYIEKPENKEAVVEYCKRQKAFVMDELVMDQETRQEVEVLAKAMDIQDPSFASKVESPDFNRNLMQNIDTAEVAKEFQDLAKFAERDPQVQQKLSWISEWVERGEASNDTGVKGLNAEQTEKLLIFITGAPSLPLEGKEIRVKGATDPESPITAMTCFNMFNLSRAVVSEEQFREQLEITLQASPTFDKQ